jgi:hypothetical protein
MYNTKTGMQHPGKDMDGHMARKGLANQIWTTDIDNVLRGLRRQGRLLQLITVCKKAKKLWIKGRDEEVGV